MVIAEDGTEKGRYLGQRSFVSDVCLPGGQIVERVNLYIIKDPTIKEEVLYLGEEAGPYQGEVSDVLMGKMLFRIHFTSD